MRSGNGESMVMPVRVFGHAIEAALDHGTTVSAILSRDRTAIVSRARRAVMHRLRQEGATTTQIGRWLGRDHSTVVVALRGGRGAKQ